MHVDDVSLLLRLRIRHARWTLNQLMHIVGAGLDDDGWAERAYQLYALVLVLGWFALMAAALADAVAKAFALLDAATCLVVLKATLVLPAVVLVWFGIRSVRSAPLKLSHPDIAYVAASAVSARALVGVAAAAQVLAGGAACGIVGLLAGIGLASAGALVLPPAAFGLVLAALGAAAVAAGWLAGVVRLGCAGWRPRASVAAGLAFAAFGATWCVAAACANAGLLFNPAALTAMGAGAALAGLASAVALAFVAPRIDMTRVIEESALFADLCRFGALSPLDRADIADYRRRRKLADRPVRFSLPPGEGRRALAARAALSHLRQYDGVFDLLVHGSAVVPLGVLAATGAGGPVLFLFWLSALVAAPMGVREATRAFRDDVRNRLVRDRLPYSALELLAFDTLPAFALTTLVACAVVVAALPAVPASMLADVPLASTLVLAVLLNAGSLLCCGLDAVRLFPGGPRLCYEYGALALVGVPFALALAAAPWLALLAGIALTCVALAAAVRFGTECAG